MAPEEGIEATRAGLAEAGYLADDSAALVSHLAQRLGKPVLVEGPAGEKAVVLDTAWDTEADADQFATALDSGVIDGLMTSIGGWLGVREQAPYYTTGGAGVFS